MSSTGSFRVMQPDGFPTSAFVREASRIEEDVLYSEKANFQVATLWQWSNFVLGLASALSAALTGLSSTGAIFPESTHRFAVATAVLTVLLTFLEPARQASLRHLAGTSFAALRSRARRFREIDVFSSASEQALREKLEILSEEKARLIASTPHTGGLPYWLSSRSIKREQHRNKGDKAIA
ncbi:SLATT domain-containing protein [Rhodobacteraceae bacterium MCCB 386]|nr:SLATT domain-containing protein [Roseitranquillus sediminis]